MTMSRFITAAVLMLALVGGSAIPAAAGKAAGSHAYSTRNTGVITLSGENPTTVASLTVPAGTYVISGKVLLNNFDSIGHRAYCFLGNDESDTSLADVTSPGAYGTIPLQTWATFSQTSTIDMTCITSNGSADEVAVTAITVGALN